jgi:ubiquinone/menaquinone biosynthesis C-methylase UbiE
MNSPFVATVYERLWRPTPATSPAASPLGPSTAARDRLCNLSTAERLLDVACGPGNFTAPLAEQLPDDGLAVGFDISAPMRTRAVLDNSGARTCYVRGDAHALPFDDETFDAVCCFGALYLMPEPFPVAREMVRVLGPGGRIAILTTYAREAAPIRYALATGARVIGLTMFGRHAFVDLCSSAGLVDVEQQTQRVSQFVAAGKPG